MYADFAFYMDEYQGNQIPETEFQRLSVPTEAQIDRVTFDRARAALAGTNEAQCRAVKRAACAVAEALYRAEQSAGVASETVGKYTVAYRDRDASREAIQAARLYLAGTGLLYPGV